MNQIFLGNRAYGFAAAADAYFGKPMKDITIAEAAMLAGLPKAPSANNPMSNPQRARGRQLYIIERMHENGFITRRKADECQEAGAEDSRDADNRPPACRVHRGDRAPDGLRAVRRRDLYPRPEGLYHASLAADQDGRLQVPAQGHHGL